MFARINNIHDIRSLYDFLQFSPSVFVFFGTMGRARLSRFQAEDELICDQQSVPSPYLQWCVYSRKEDDLWGPTQHKFKT